MRVLDLFSGIGGFSVGLEHAGLRTVAFCEQDEFARAVLAKHWPHVPCYADVRTLSAARLAADGIGAIDLICGGFPCQDISLAGSGAGIDGARSKLWREFARLTRELSPAYIVVENSSALLGRGLSTVLGDLAALGMSAEWHCIPAAAVGAPHIRDRIWIVAYADRESVRHDEQRQARRRLDISHRRHAEPVHDGGAQLLADADSRRCEVERVAQYSEQQSPSGDQPDRCSARRPRSRSDLVLDAGWWDEASVSFEHWLAEPGICRVADGVPNRVDRLRCLGNAVVPQIPEAIGRAIMIHHGEATHA